MITEPPSLPLVRRGRPDARARPRATAAGQRAAPTGRARPPEPRYPLDLGLLPALLAGADHRDRPARELFGDYLYFSSFSTRCWTHARGARRAVVPSGGSAPTASSSRSPATTATCSSTTRERACRCSASSRPRNIGRGRPTSAASRPLVEFFGDELAAARSPPRAARRRHPRQQRAGARARPQRLRRRVSRRCSSDDGVAVIEAPTCDDLIDHVEFDTIYHEHLCYFSLTALDALFAPARPGAWRRRAPADPRRLAAALRRRTPARRAEPGAWPSAARPRSSACGVADPAYYRGFSDRVAALKTAAVDAARRPARPGQRARRLRRRGQGRMLLNHFGIGTDTIDFVVDRSTHKQGRFMPGVAHPHRPPEPLLVRPARLRAAAGLELRRRDPRPAGGVPRRRRHVHRARCPSSTVVCVDDRGRARSSRCGGSPTSAGTILHMLRAHRSALPRVRRDLLLHRLPRAWSRAGTGTGR